MFHSIYSERFAFHTVEVDYPVLVEVYCFYYDRFEKTWKCLVNVRFKQKLVNNVSEVRI